MFKPSTALALSVAALVGLGLPPGAAGQTPSSTETLLQSFKWRPIGPVNAGGRITDVEAIESNPSTIYVGAATGGVWKTTNNGTTWQSIFDQAPCTGVGDLNVSQTQPHVVWVGTGEANPRQSISYGCGVFKSTDAGKSFSFMGLGDSGHIGRVVVDPKDANIVYVAAVGHVFRSSEERGLYKTTNGGQTWTKSKYIDADTGFTDVVMSPADNRTLLAASYQRRRTAWGFNGGGPNSAIWKSTDAGATWRRITAGLGNMSNVGRIRFGYSRKEPRIVYALIEKGPSLAPDPSGAAAARTPAPGSGVDPNRSALWRSDDGGESWNAVSAYSGRAMYTSVLQVDPQDSNRIFMAAGKVGRSTDGGRTFDDMGQLPQRMTHPHGYKVIDIHAIWIDPRNKDHVMVGHDGGLQFTWDGGETWQFQNVLPLAQFYDIGVDMRRPYYIYGGTQDNGTWGGPSMVRNNNGITQSNWFQLTLGPNDGWHARVDPDDWRTVYAAVSPGYPFMFGNIWRFDLATGDRQNIRPMGPAGTGDPDPLITPTGTGSTAGGTPVVPTPPANETYRWAWNSPFIVSPHNSRTLHYGGNKLFTSRDRGNTWTASKDLTKQLDRDKMPIMGLDARQRANALDGVAWYGTIASIAESPLVPGVLWVGTDDGNLQLSRDSGATWTELSARVGKFDPSTFVESIAASNFDPATAYVAWDGHWGGDFRPLLYKTTDFGQSWVSISANLPNFGHINVVREDPKNRNVLYVGTEMGFFISVDGGRAWTKFMNNLPATPAEDLVIHPRDNDLVLGTHGRGIFILDDITPLQQLTEEVLKQDVHLFQPRAGVQWIEDRTSNPGGGYNTYRAENPIEGTYLSYYLRTPARTVTLSVIDAAGKTVRELSGPVTAGISRVAWDLRVEPPPSAKEPQPRKDSRMQPEIITGDRVPPGLYVVRLQVDGRMLSTTVTVESDPSLSSR